MFRVHISIFDLIKTTAVLSAETLGSGRYSMTLTGSDCCASPGATNRKKQSAVLIDILGQYSGYCQ